jgi:hypothetical protein
MIYLFILVRPSPIASQPTNVLNSRPQQSQTAYSLRVPRPPHSRSSTVTIPNNSFTPVVQRYQVPLLPPTTSAPPPPLPPSSSSSQSLLNLAATNSQRSTVNKINHKNLPFYRPIACVYERYQIFRYDNYRKQHISHDEFILPFDVCNQLALSYDYDSNLNIHKTTKCLLLRLVRIDQPATLNGKYEDNLPPNLSIHVNGNQLTNLPTPKASTRQQNDLLRIGREIDITPNCMFNPILKNDLTIAWSYRSDNTNLQLQYNNAQYALHIFLVEHLTTEELRDQVLKKPMRFFREDLVRLLAKAHANDRDLGLEVSDQKLKLICPIDQRRLKTPVRATTCQHLQCFDLTNYIGKLHLLRYALLTSEPYQPHSAEENSKMIRTISPVLSNFVLLLALNEKSNKWICPVCNKSALFEDLQIDSHTESILDSIHNENITEITIDSGLNWTPINPPNSINDPFDLKSNTRFISSSSSSLSNDIIFLDGDD